MIVIKKLHDDIGDDGDIANIAIIAGANFSPSITPGLYPATPKRLYIHYILFNYSLIINSTNYGSLYSNYRFGSIHRCIK